MDIEAQIRSAALFFFLALLDEDKATQLASSLVKAYRKKVSDQDADDPSFFVYLMSHRIQKLKTASQNQLLTIRPINEWLIPEGCDFGKWQAFAKKSEHEELHALIWSQILGLADADIAKGIGVSEGTVRYRVGRALIKLGEQIIES